MEQDVKRSGRTSAHQQQATNPRAKRTLYLGRSQTIRGESSKWKFMHSRRVLKLGCLGVVGNSVL
eukprot:1210949-Amphidinium_carterae.1